MAIDGVFGLRWVLEHLAKWVDDFGFELFDQRDILIDEVIDVVFKAGRVVVDFFDLAKNIGDFD